MNIRPYQTSDYEKVADLYKRKDLYGGQFDEGRDSGARLAAQIEKKPDSILVAEEDGKIVGTVSLIYDERVAWLFRFAAEPAAVEPLYEKAVEVLRSHGHKQVLVYSESGNRSLDERYVNLGFNQGNDFTAFWREI